MPPLHPTPPNQAVSSSQDVSSQDVSSQAVSSQDLSSQDVSSKAAPIVSGKPDNPMCPTCQRAMTVKLVMPLMSAIGVDETVYACDACGTETHRAAKRR